MNVRQFVKRSPLAALVTLALRARTVTRYEWQQARRSCDWLVVSREYTNFNDELTTENVVEMAWFVAAVTGLGFDQSFEHIEELHNDQLLREHLRRAVADSPLRRVMDPEPRDGRRAAWYAIVRARHPRHVVESGVDKGLGSCVLAAALLRNADEGHHGRLTALVMTDHGGLALSDYAKFSGRRFLVLREDPADHWAPGGVLGVATSVSK